MKLKNRKTEVLDEVSGSHVTFRLELLVRGLPAPQKKAKNKIKIKRRSALFSSFVRTVGWSALLSLWGARGLDGWSSYRWCRVDGLRGCCHLIRMIFME